jgi:phosphatidylinositol alpha-1,6-mannosyltransferase
MLLNQSGFVIDCTDANSISTTVATLLSDPTGSTEMGKIGRKHIESELDWQAHVQKASLLFNQ